MNFAHTLDDGFVAHTYELYVSFLTTCNKLIKDKGKNDSFRVFVPEIRLNYNKESPKPESPLQEIKTIDGIEWFIIHKSAAEHDYGKAKLCVGGVDVRLEDDYLWISVPKKEESKIGPTGKHGDKGINKKEEKSIPKKHGLKRTRHLKI